MCVRTTSSADWEGLGTKEAVIVTGTARAPLSDSCRSRAMLFESHQQASLGMASFVKKGFDR